MIYIAKNYKDKRMGYQDNSSLSTASSILFPEVNNITMANTGRKLKIQFLKNGKIIEEVIGKPYERKPYVNANADSVLETPILEDGGVLAILDENGKPQMKIKEGARIFSREHTKKMIDASNKLKVNPSTINFQELGKMITQFINKQNNK